MNTWCSWPSFETRGLATALLRTRLALVAQQRLPPIRPRPEERAKRASRRTATGVAEDKFGHRGAHGSSESPNRTWRPLSLSTAFAPACGHMTDRRRYRDSPATWPPSASRGDIRYLLCLPEFVPRIHVPTPAFRGSFRFEHYPLTGAAESS